MTSKAEEIASRCMRALLSPLPPGSSIEDCNDFQTFQSALERLIPAELVQAYPLWQYESLDAFRFAVARKLGPDEAEFIGLCLLITDQAWTPLHLRLRISPRSDRIEWLECKLGESGPKNGGMLTTPYGSPGENKLLHSVVERLASINWVYAIIRGSPRHVA